VGEQPKANVLDVPRSGIQVSEEVEQQPH